MAVKMRIPNSYQTRWYSATYTSPYPTQVMHTNETAYYPLTHTHMYTSITAVLSKKAVSLKTIFLEKRIQSFSAMATSLLVYIPLNKIHYIEPPNKIYASS